MFDWYESSVWLGKLLLAALLGGAVGFERETHGQAAGLRTNLLVTMGSCLMMMLSLHIEELFSGLDATSSVRVDPARIASYAVAGMGFLGGGAILKGKGSVRGLTTAASLWLNTGIGLAIGANYFLPAVYASLISVAILYNLRFMKHLFPHDVPTILTIGCSTTEKPLNRIKKILSEYKELDITFLNYHLDLQAGKVRYRFRISCKKSVRFGIIIDRLKREIDDLNMIAWEEGDVP